MTRVKTLNKMVLLSLALLGSGCLRISGANYGLYHGVGQNPNLQSPIPDSQIATDIGLLGLTAENARFFSCDANQEKAIRKAKALPSEFQVGIYAGAWISSDAAENERQLQCLTRICGEGLCQAAIVGTEVLLRNDVSENTLLGYIKRVQDALPDVPVTTADTYDRLLGHPKVIEQVDFVMANIYPYWEGVAVDEAVQFVHTRYLKLQAATTKEVIVGETGWPSCGPPLGKAVPSPENAAFFFANVVTWSRVEKVKMFYFELFDEPWKVQAKGNPVGTCWGILEADYRGKPGMGKPLNEMYPTPINWNDSGIPGGPGDPQIQLTFVPPVGSGEYLRGRVLHVAVDKFGLAVFIRVRGRWWMKPYQYHPMTYLGEDGSFVTDIVTGGVDHEATEIAVFLVPINYSIPVVLNWTELPDSLYDDALTYVQITR